MAWTLAGTVPGTLKCSISMWPSLPHKVLAGFREIDRRRDQERESGRNHFLFHAVVTKVIVLIPPSSLYSSYKGTLKFKRK